MAILPIAALESGFAGQCTEDVAGTQLVGLAAVDAQGGHCRLRQLRGACGGQWCTRPLQGLALFGFQRLGARVFTRGDQA